MHSITKCLPTCQLGLQSGQDDLRSIEACRLVLAASLHWREAIGVVAPVSAQEGLYPTPRLFQPAGQVRGREELGWNRRQRRGFRRILLDFLAFVGRGSSLVSRGVRSRVGEGLGWHLYRQHAADALLFVQGGPLRRLDSKHSG